MKLRVVAVFAAVACSLPGCLKVTPARTLTVVDQMDPTGLFGGPSDDNSLHPAVVSAIMHHPAMPWAFGGHEGVRPGDGTYDVEATAKALNNVLRNKAKATVMGGGAAAIVIVSKRARLIYVRWFAGATWGVPAIVMFDVSAIRGAFEPQATLSPDTVARQLVVMRETP